MSDETQFGISKVVPVVADTEGRLVALTQAESLRESRPPLIKKRHIGLGQISSTAIAGNDLLSSCLYTAGVVASFAGPFAPLCLSLLALLLYCYRFIYAEVVTAIPVNGGSYNVLLNVAPKRVAATAAVLSMLTYIATAVVSAVDSMHYLQVLWPALDIRAGTIIILAIFAFFAILGIGESAIIAVLVFTLHLLMMTVLIIASIVYAFKDNWNTFAANWKEPFPDITNSATGGLIAHGSWITALFFGYCSAALGITGFETAANFVEEMHDNRTYVYTLRNLWILVSLYNPLLSLASMAVVPLDTIYDHPADLLAIVGIQSGGPSLEKFVSIDAVIVLAGAVLTSYVGVIGLFSRLSADAVLPEFIGILNSFRGTPHWAILVFFLACSSLFLAIFSPTNSNTLVELGGVHVYSISFLTVMLAFALGSILLKVQRPDMPRLVIAPIWVIVLGFFMVFAGLIGNIVVEPQMLINFFIFFAAIGRYDHFIYIYI
jgi:amino acid transporter